MKTMLTAAAALAVLAAAAPAFARQDAPRPTITVVGVGDAEAPPEVFSLTADIEGRGADQAEAVRRLAEVQTAVSDALPRLDGLTSSRFNTDAMTLLPVQSGCQGATHRQDDGCPITGYVARMTVSLEGAPAERGGDAVSLAGERGARNARLEAFSIADERGLRRRAAQAAFADARRQAEDIAEASGQRIVRVATVADPSADGSVFRLAANISGVIDANYYGADYVAPATPVGLTPAPIRVESRLAVVFEVE